MNDKEKDTHVTDLEIELALKAKENNAISFKTSSSSNFNLEHAILPWCRQEEKEYYIKN